MQKLVAFASGLDVNAGALDETLLRDILSAHARTLLIAPDEFDDAVAEAVALVLSPEDAGTDDGLPRDPNRPPD